MKNIFKFVIFIFLFFTYLSTNLNAMLAGTEGFRETYNTLDEAIDGDDNFLSDITLESWLTDETAHNITRVLKIFNDRTSSWLKNNNLWINHTAPTELLNGIHSGEIKNPHLQNVNTPASSVLPFLVKWVVGENCVEFKIGDLHGNMDTLTKILLNLKIGGLPILDANMRMHPRAKIVFLGDYMDRGMKSLKVLATAALLALKNPGQVLMLRGNHEDLVLNLLGQNLYNEIIKITAAKEIFDQLFIPDEDVIPYEKTLYNAIQNSLIEKVLLTAGICDPSLVDRSYEKLFDPEMNQKIDQFSSILLNHTEIKEIITELSKLYELLPLGAFVGFEGKLPIKFVFNCHGCIDIRINYRYLLEHDTENMAQSGGIKLWQLTPQAMIPQENLFEIYKEITHEDPCDVGTLLFRFLKQNYTTAFTWNDVWAGLENFVAKGKRGPNTFIIDTEFIKAFLSRFNSPNVFICGMARGHQHDLPKEVAILIDAEKDFGVMCKRSTSPSVLFTSNSESHENLATLLQEEQEFDIFSAIITIISGTVLNEPEKLIVYPSACLETHKNMINGLPRTKLIYLE